MIAYVDGHRKLDAAKFAPKPEVVAAALAAAAPAAVEVPAATQDVPAKPISPAETPSEASGVVEVQSNPGAASVFVDGTFMANTPATLHVSPGPHSVRIRLDGYKEWNQDCRVETGAPGHLSTELEKLNLRRDSCACRGR